MIYRVDSDAIVLLDVFSKKTAKTPAAVIRACKARLRRYDELTRS
jgi:phage-related protein